VLGLPPDWEIEFPIDLATDTTLMSKTSYRVAPAKFAELKIQL